MADYCTLTKEEQIKVVELKKDYWCFNRVSICTKCRYIDQTKYFEHYIDDWDYEVSCPICDSIESEWL